MFDKLVQAFVDPIKDDVIENMSSLDWVDVFGDPRMTAPFAEKILTYPGCVLSQASLTLILSTVARDLELDTALDAVNEERLWDLLKQIILLVPIEQFEKGIFIKTATQIVWSDHAAIKGTLFVSLFDDVTHSESFKSRLPSLMIELIHQFDKERFIALIQALNFDLAYRTLHIFFQYCVDVPEGKRWVDGVRFCPSLYARAIADEHWLLASALVKNLSDEAVEKSLLPIKFKPLLNMSALIIVFESNRRQHLDAPVHQIKTSLRFFYPLDEPGCSGCLFSTPSKTSSKGMIQSILGQDVCFIDIYRKLCDGGKQHHDLRIISEQVHRSYCDLIDVRNPLCAPHPLFNPVQW